MSDRMRADLVEAFRKALMVEHHDDWTMETISEAAHVCAEAVAGYAGSLNERLHALVGVDRAHSCEHACTHIIYGEWSALGAANVLGRHS